MLARIDAAEDARAARARDARGAGGQPAEGAAREPGEGNRFDIIGIEPERRGGRDPGWGELSGEGGEQRRIVRTAAAGIERGARRVAAHGIAQRGGCVFEQRGLHVLRTALARFPDGRRSQDMLKSSRPVLLGGGSARYGSASRRSNNPGSLRPVVLQAPCSSKASPRWRKIQASSSRFAGPVSKPETAVPRASTVILAMPPRFKMTRSSASLRNT